MYENPQVVLMIKKKFYALFEMFVIVSAIFSIINLNSVPVSAQTVISGDQKSCCQKTLSGSSCVFTNNIECDPNFLSAPTSCDQTSFCKLGCCFNENSGNCFKNTPRSLCQSQANSTWKEGASCDIPQCTKGCCVLSNECSFVTQTRCKSETSKFADVNATFLSEINTELGCINQCRSLDRGACVKQDGSCVFTTRESCGVEITTTDSPLSGVNKSTIGFHKDFLCSHPALGTNCARQQKTGCLSDKDEVYWLDSCGNPENIYSSNKLASFNNGFILNKEQSCQISGPEDPGCGNCDFAKSTLCKEASREKSPVFGKFTCKSIACSAQDVFKSPTSPASGGPKKAGESWCNYDGPVGFGRDLVGSRHLRKICIDGQEIIDECADFREELCVQGNSGEPPFDNFQTFFLSGQGKYIEAACRDNRWETCNAANQIAIGGCGADCDFAKAQILGCEGSDCDVIKVQRETACCRKKACDNLALRDCFWAPFGVSDLRVKPEDGGGFCVPHIPPGIRFWEAGLSENAPAGSSTTLAPPLNPQAAFNQATTTQTAGLTLCSQATQKCNVKYEKGGIDRVFGIGEYECLENCNCLTREWIVGSNNLCKASGDCGAYFNIEGKPTFDGFSENVNKFALELADLNDFTTFSKGFKSKEGSYEFTDLMKRLAIPLTFIAAAGLYTGFAKSLEGASFGTGLSPLTGTALGWIPKFNVHIGALKEALKTTTKISAEAAAKKTTAESAVKIAEANLKGERSKFILGNVPGAEAQLEAAEGAVQSATKSATKSAEALQAGSPPTWSIFRVINTLAWAYTISQMIDMMFKKTKTDNLVAECRPWVAPPTISNSDCDKCNKPGVVCSEYRCRSLGQSCQLVNPGTTEEKCVDIHPNDVTSPIITPDINALPSGFKVSDQKGEGFSITPQFKAFQAISIGITTNEPAQCKVSLNHSVKFEQMPPNFFGSPSFKTNHTMLFSLPQEVTSPELIKLTNGGRFELFTRCIDAKGNSNNRDYFIKFSIEKGPDLTPPSLEVTSIEDNSFLQFNTTETDLSIFLNEPSECKYDKFDIDFKNMQNNFTCVTSSTSRTPLFQGLFECKTKLTNLALGDNKFFFRCKDQIGVPEDKRNVNEESFPFTLRMAKQLKATLLSPLANTTLFISNTTLKVRTEEGAENGKAKCAFSEKNVPVTDMALFLNTESTEHTQNLILPKGNYNFFIKCIDIAGNLVDLTSKFTIQVDTQPPQLTSIFKQGNLLTLSIDEEADCESASVDFRFGEGTKMLKQSLTHQSSMESSLMFIVCKDTNGNEAKFKITD